MRKKTREPRRGSGRNRITSLVLITLFIAIPGILGSQEFDQSLASDLVEEARVLIELGDHEGARFLLRRAYAVDPEAGDPLVLLAVIEPQTRETRHFREHLLRRAGTLRLRTVSEEKRLEALARVLIDTGRSGEAVDILDRYLHTRDGVGAVHAAMSAVLEPSLIQLDAGVHIMSDDSKLAELERLFLEALLESDPGWFSSAILARVRARFPEDRHAAYIDWSRARALSSMMLESIDTQDPRMLRLLVNLLPPERTVLRDYVTSRYYLSGGDDPIPAIKNALLYAETGATPRTYREYLPEEIDWNRDKRIWETIARYRTVSDWTEDLPEPFDEAYRSLRDSENLELERPSNRGTSVEVYRVDDTYLRRWYLDENGDGLFDWIVDFDTPEVRLYHRENDQVLRVDYRPYPLVTGVNVYPIVPESDRWRIDPPAERIDPGGARRWVPPQPVPFDPDLRLHVTAAGVHPFAALDDPAGFPLPLVLAGQIAVNPTVQERFVRQLDSVDSRPLSEFDSREETGYLRSLGMIR